MAKRARRTTSRRKAPRRTYKRARRTYKRSYTPRKVYRAKTSIPRGKSGVEEVLAAPHSAYAKSNAVYTANRSVRKARYNTIRKRYVAGQQARAPYRDLYKSPKIIQPKMDNWTWLRDPDLHYRMNRKKYDKYFKTGLGVVTENLFGLLGQPVGKVAKGVSDALFDIATDYDTRRPFNTDHIVDSALKTGKSLILPELKKALRSKDSDRLSFHDRYGLGHHREPKSYLNDFLETPYSSPSDPNWLPPVGRWGWRDYMRTVLPELESNIPVMNLDKVRTTFTPRKSWRDFIPQRGPASRTRETRKLENLLRNSTIDDLVNTNVSETTQRTYYPDGSYSTRFDDELYSDYFAL